MSRVVKDPKNPMGKKQVGIYVNAQRWAIFIEGCQRSGHSASRRIDRFVAKEIEKWNEETAKVGRQLRLEIERQDT